MHFLSLLGGGGLAGADGPHRLVGDDDGAPVGDPLPDGVKLALIHHLGLAGLAFV